MTTITRQMINGYVNLINKDSSELMPQIFKYNLISATCITCAGYSIKLMLSSADTRLKMAAGVATFALYVFNQVNLRPQIDQKLNCFRGTVNWLSSNDLGIRLKYRDGVVPFTFGFFRRLPKLILQRSQ